MIELLLKIGPWIGMLAAIVFGLFKHQQSKTIEAEADKKVAEVETKAAKANAEAAQEGGKAVQERTNVENDIASRPAGDSAQRLRDDWSR